MNTYAVFTDLAALPTQGEIEEELRIGAPPPDTFAAGEYLQCTTAACTTAAASGVRVYTHKDSGGALDDKAVFRILRNGTRITYLANKVSNVTVAGGAFAFRNPPKFHSFLRPSIRDAEHETEALLDFLHWHSNHPPFVAKSLIKRFTSSNPSPRYVKAVADAFKTGTFGGVTYGGSTATSARPLPPSYSITRHARQRSTPTRRTASCASRYSRSTTSCAPSTLRRGRGSTRTSQTSRVTLASSTSCRQPSSTSM